MRALVCRLCSLKYETVGSNILPYTTKNPVEITKFPPSKTE